MNAARRNRDPERAKVDDRAAKGAEPTRLDEESFDTPGGDAPPHALWQQLDQWANGQPAHDDSPPKPPIAARVAIITGLSLVCWIVLIALILLI